MGYYSALVAAAVRNVRALALIAVAAVAVHELRFAVGFGGADEHLARDEHAYLALGASLAAVILLVALGLFAHTLREARRTGVAAASEPTSFVRTWLWASGALVTIYTGQELLEPAFSADHPAGLAGVLGHAGWTAVIFAFLLGAVVALAPRRSRRGRAGGHPKRSSTPSQAILTHFRGTDHGPGLGLGAPACPSPGRSSSALSLSLTF